jgi:hypothetical protein
MHSLVLVLVPSKADDPWEETKRLLEPFREWCMCCPCDQRCEECTAYKPGGPEPKWDWYAPGGRFDGAVRNEEPERFKRLWGLMGAWAKSPIEREDGTVMVEFRHGDEWRERFGQIHNEMIEANIVPTRRLPADFSPRAVITPDGSWHDFGYGRDLTPEDRRELEPRRQALLTEHNDCLAVACDLHM